MSAKNIWKPSISWNDDFKKCLEPHERHTFKKLTNLKLQIHHQLLIIKFRFMSKLLKQNFTFEKRLLYKTNQIYNLPNTLKTNLTIFYVYFCINFSFQLNCDQLFTNDFKK